MTDTGPRYFRRRWEELRGDACDAWGRSTWLFETDAAGVVTRQVEQFDSGPMLRYHADHLGDEHGGLTDQPIDLAEFAPFEITAEEFEQVWRGGEGDTRRRADDGRL